jgi:hypothetical protein
VAFSINDLINTIILGKMSIKNSKINNKNKLTQNIKSTKLAQLYGFYYEKATNYGGGLK